MMVRPPIELLDEDRFVRLAAIERSSSDQSVALLYALRGVIAEDPDATIRTRALERVGLASVRRMGGPMLVAISEAARFALSDPSMLVREMAARTVGRLRDEAAPPLLVRALEADPQWRVRRAAARALAEIQKEGALDALVQALDDPFWRVRHAVVQCLSAWPARLPEIEDSGSSRRRAALQYLRRGDALLDAAGPEHEQADILDSGAYPHDPDPAVFTVRVRRSSAARLSVHALVDCLASPHDELRRAAIQKLIERSSTEDLVLAIGHLNEPRTPYASAAVARLMSHVDRTPIVERILSSSDTMQSGALRWALEQLDEVVLAGLDEERERVLASSVERLATHRDWRVRRAVVQAWPVAPGVRDTLTIMLRDPSADVREQAIEALGSVLPQPDMSSLLRAMDWEEEDPAVARMAVRVLDNAGDTAGLRTLLDRSPSSSWIRAHVLIALARVEDELTSEERQAARTDTDPWVRLAVLDLDHALEILESDPDPQLRRAAADLFRLSAHAMTKEHRALAAAVTCRDPDPWIRAVSTKLLDARQPADLARLLGLTRDRALMARSAAALALEQAPLVMDRCVALLSTESMDEGTRLALHGWLAREGAPRGLAALTAELERPELSDSAADTLRALSLVYPAELTADSKVRFVPRPRGRTRAESADSRADEKERSEIPQRRLGRTGLKVAPLAISGAFDLPPSSYAAASAAGVNVFFWEPEYRGLGDFLARHKSSDRVVVTGSYEADERTIVRDAERALRRLRTDCLGVFLLFWVRSPARLSDEAWEAMRALQRSGKVRAIGFSTHARELAIEAIGSGRWDVVMTRHSAAHVGAERALLPCAVEHDVGVLGFSSLVYGRMLVDPRDGSAIQASSCYRYSLSQPGVGAVLSAPRSHHELMENLEVLKRPQLDAAAIDRMREHGARVYEQNRAFQRLIRAIDG